MQVHAHSGYLVCRNARIVDGTVATPIAPTVEADIALGFNGNDVIAGKNNEYDLC